MGKDDEIARRAPEDIHDWLEKQIGPQDRGRYNAWVIDHAKGKPSDGVKPERDLLTMIRYAQRHDAMLDKPDLYPRRGRASTRFRRLTMSRHESFVSQLNEVCQRMAWPMPEWQVRSKQGPIYVTHFACVTVRDDKDAILAACEDEVGDTTKSATREAVARLALEQFLDYEDE